MSRTNAYEAVRAALSNSHASWSEVLEDFDSQNWTFAQAVVNPLVALTGGDIEYLQSTLSGSPYARLTSVLAFTRDRIVTVQVSQTGEPSARSTVCSRSDVRSIVLTNMSADYREHGRGLTDVAFEVVLGGSAAPLSVGVDPAAMTMGAQTQQRARVLALFRSLLGEIDARQGR